MEQVTNSPLLQNWFLADTSSLYQPVFDLFESGKQQKIFKQEDTQVLITFPVLPIAQLAKSQISGEYQLDQQKLDLAIQMSWNAIKAC